MKTKKQPTAYAVGNTDPGLGQVQNCGGVKPINVWTVTFNNRLDISIILVDEFVNGTDEEKPNQNPTELLSYISEQRFKCY